MSLILGRQINRVGIKQNDDLVLSSKSLLKHFVCFGGSGSGKTYLLKKIIEEVSLKKIPSIIIDTQGDFSSLNLLNKNNEENVKWRDVQVRVFTPTRKNGLELAFDPFFDVTKSYESTELIDVISNSADSFTNLLGYDVYSDEGKSVSAALYLIFEYYFQNKQPITFTNLIQFLGETNPISPKIREFLTNSKLAQLIKKIKILTVGKNKLIYDGKIKYDLDVLMKEPAINVINVTGVENEATRLNIINMIVSGLYNYMIRNPSNKLSSLFCIDEVSTYIPAGSKKPLTKDLLQLLFKQARKYGVGCLIATQNPGDIDYKSLAQFSSWSIGRLNTKQDFKKIESAMNSISESTNFKDQLPALQTGQFLLYSPDNYDKSVLFQSDEILTNHLTLGLKEIKVDEDIKANLESQFTCEKLSTSTLDSQVKPLSGEFNKGFPINIEDDRLSKIIQKNKKRFLMLFSELEQVGEVELKYLPMYFCKLKVKEPKYLGLKHSINEYSVFFDAVKLNPMQFNNFDFHHINGFNSFLNLKEFDMRVFREIFLKKKISAAEIALKLNSSTRSVSYSINKMIKENLLAEKLDGKIKSYSVMVNFDVPFKMKKLSVQEDYSFYNLPVGSTDTASLDKLKEILSVWFGECSLIDHQVVYMPYYDVTLSDKKTTRSLKINASSGNIINFD